MIGGGWSGAVAAVARALAGGARCTIGQIADAAGRDGCPADRRQVAIGVVLGALRGLGIVGADGSDLAGWCWSWRSHGSLLGTPTDADVRCGAADFLAAHAGGWFEPRVLAARLRPAICRVDQRFRVQVERALESMAQVGLLDVDVRRSDRRIFYRWGVRAEGSGPSEPTGDPSAKR